MVSTADVLLGDLSNIKTFTEDALELLEEMTSYENEQFSNWVQEIRNALSDTSEEGSLALETTGRLMDFEHE